MRSHLQIAQCFQRRFDTAAIPKIAFVNGWKGKIACLMHGALPEIELTDV